MVIGCYDEDMVSYIRAPFNIDLMKISSYYKSRNNVVSITNHLDINKYSKFFYRKDYYDGKVKAEILTNPKVNYGGRAFSVNKYIQMPLDIEEMKPDKTLYLPMKDYFCSFFTKDFGSTKAIQNLYKLLYEATDVRFSLNGSNVWENYEKQIYYKNDSTTNLIIHDYNPLEISDIHYAIKNVLQNVKNNRFKRVGVKYPVSIYNNDSRIFKWLDYKLIPEMFNIELEGICSDEFFFELCSSINNKAIFSNSFYNLTENYPGDENFLKEKMPHLYHQIVFLCNNGIRIPLIYDKEVFSNPQIGKVLSLFVMFLANSNSKWRSRHRDEYSLYRYIRESTNASLRTNYYNQYGLNKNDIRNLFTFIKDNNYDLFKDFYECHIVKLEGGNFKPYAYKLY